MTTTEVDRPAKQSVEQFIASKRSGLEMALAGKVPVDTFVSAAVSTFRSAPALQNCDPETIMGALWFAAQLGLEVGGPRAYTYLVPFGRQAQLIVGPKGWLELYYRAGARRADVFVVREGDDFHQWASASSGGRDFRWEPQDSDSERKPVGYLAYVVLASGDVQFEYMTVQQVLARRPGRAKDGPWESWPEEMGKKTVLKALSKTVRLSTNELALAADRDDTIQRRIEGLTDPVVEHPEVTGASVPTDPDSVFTYSADELTEGQP